MGGNRWLKNWLYSLGEAWEFLMVAQLVDHRTKPWDHLIEKVKGLDLWYYRAWLNDRRLSHLLPPPRLLPLLFPLYPPPEPTSARITTSTWPPLTPETVLGIVAALD